MERVHGKSQTRSREDNEGESSNESSDDFFEWDGERFRVQNFDERGSHWRFQRVISLHIHLAEYKPFNDRSYIKLPDSFQRKKAVLNIKNKDNNCFQWCIARVLNPNKLHPERISDLRGKTNQVNFTGIKFSVKLRDIDRFEKQNEGIAVIVFGLDRTKVYPLRITERNIRERKEKRKTNHPQERKKTKHWSSSDRRGR